MRVESRGRKSGDRGSIEASLRHSEAIGSIMERASGESLGVAEEVVPGSEGGDVGPPRAMIIEIVTRSGVVSFQVCSAL